MIMYIISCDHTPGHVMHRRVEVIAFEQKAVVQVLRTNDVNLLAEEVMGALGDCDE